MRIVSESQSEGVISVFNNTVVINYEHTFKTSVHALSETKDHFTFFTFYLPLFLLSRYTKVQHLHKGYIYTYRIYLQSIQSE